MASYNEMRRRRSNEARKIANRLDDALDVARNAVFEVERPAVLCHYTDKAGLFGILRSNEMWLFGFADQETDRFELRHADRGILDMTAILGRDASLLPSERAHLLEFMHGWPGESLAERAADRFFLACFSEPSDNPKLWRGTFGRQCSGYAIEFEVLKEEVVIPDVGFGLFKVQYDEALAARTVERVFREYFTVYQKLVPLAYFDHPEPQGKLHRALRVAAATAAALTKSPEHEGDLEWRIVALATDNTAVKRVGQGRPHVRMPLRERPSDKPVIRAIHIGAEAPPEAEGEIFELIDQLRYPRENRPEIVRSKVRPLP